MDNYLHLRPLLYSMPDPERLAAWRGYAAEQRRGECVFWITLERQAGVDLARLRRQYPRLKFIGGFDKMTMPRGEAAMRAEFERLLPVAQQGGAIISVDHQTPPGISLAQAKTHLSRLARRIKQGETVVLCDRNKPFAEIHGLPQRKAVPRTGRALGLYAGQVILSPDFDSPETNRHYAL